MVFPWSLVRSILWHILSCRIRGRRPTMVLMLEPLFACNLRCEGCGRIREFADVLNQRLSVPQCLAAAEECGAPVVSICGGEPLLYSELPALVAGLLAQGRHLYLCTNGLLVPRWLDRLPRSPRLTWNIHLDGMEATHDALTGRPGTFREVADNIRKLKAAGYRVTTNTTIYRQTDTHEILVLLDFLSELAVDGMLLSPAYPYPVVNGRAVVNGGAGIPPGAGRDASGSPSPADGEASVFMAREECRAWFQAIREELKQYRLLNSPLYLSFLVGQRELPCAAWASPTYNIRGWRSPCYLLADAHYSSFAEWQAQTPWDRLGPGSDPRCRDCLVHYGFETAAAVTASSWEDRWALAKWQMGMTGHSASKPALPEHSLSPG